MRHALPLVALLLSAAGQVHAQTYDFSPVTSFIRSFVGNGPEDLIPGASLIVVQNGQPIYEQSFGSYGRGAPKVSVASSSKWLSALVVQRLVESGRMSWGDTVADYFGTGYSNATPQKNEITLGQLFSHTAGINTEPATCLSAEHKGMPLDKCALSILAKALAWRPGTTFDYGGNSIQVAGAMAQRATGLTWAQLVEAELTGPLGMTRTDYGTDKRGRPFANPNIAGGARSTSSDYSRVVQMVLQHGMIDGMQYLSAEGIAEMQRDQTLGVPIAPGSDSGPEAYGYGYGEWRDWIDCNGRAIHISSNGAFGTSPWVDYQGGIAAVFLAYKQFPDPKLHDDIAQVWQLVANAVGSAPPVCDSATRPGVSAARGQAAGR